ncbi:MAG: CoA ester lyase [Acidimicrobiia bacterium]|nr:CoA ester lyase [Acidimicrobiia bacterium]
MTGSRLRLRSALFAPASRPELLPKLPRSGPDGVIIDLEDAVAPAGKERARPVAAAAARRLRQEHPDLAIFVRVNGVGTEWFEGDMAEAVVPELTGVAVPVLESAAAVETVAERLEPVGPLDVIAGLETVAGVERAAEVLRPPVMAAYFGAEDYIADMGGVRTPENTEVLYARSRVAVACRLAGALALDQVVVALRDEEAFCADARQGRALGYRGKLCIHPAQVTWANGVFRPSAAALDRARRLLDLYAETQRTGTGAVAFEGQMIDEPLARQARALLAAAED